MRRDPIVAREIAACPFPVFLEPRKRHLLVRVDGLVVTKLPLGNPHGAGRAAMNVRAAIRKAVRERQGGQP